MKDTPLAPTKAIPAAKKASAASDAANAKLQAATKAAGQGTPAAPATPAPSASGSKAAATPAVPKTSAGSAAARGDTKQERTILRELAHGKVVVMLFWSADGADDIATRGAVRSLKTHKGKVKVHVIPIGRVGDYGSITRGVKIAQSPTTVIIGHGGKTRTIVGLSEPEELSQAVGDALAKR